MSLDEEDIFIIWWMRRRLKKEATRRKCWVKPYFIESCKAGSSVADTNWPRPVRDEIILQNDRKVPDC
jgi:hypothetical protein